MNNGEGARESTSEVTSPNYRLLDGDKLYQAHKFEGCVDGLSTPMSSKYSSCGESEFERYCSANSLFGTPSVCSSNGTFHEYMESDYGSVKSSAFGDNDWGLDGFNLNGKSPRKVEDNSHVLSLAADEVGSSIIGDGQEAEVLDKRWACYGNPGFSSSGETVPADVDRTMSNPGTEERIDLVHDVNKRWGKDNDGKKRKEDLGMLLSSVENVMTATDGNNELFINKYSKSSSVVHEDAQLFHSGFDELFTRPTLESAGNKDRRYEEQGNASSRDEHSEGEDSMFNHGSDDENNEAVYHARNAPNLSVCETERGNIVPMGSSVASGSNDWEDFELDREENAPSLGGLLQTWVREEQNAVTRTNYLDSTAIGSIGHVNLDCQEKKVAVNNSHHTSKQSCGVDEPVEVSKKTNGSSISGREASVADHGRDKLTTHKEVPTDDGSEEYLEGCYVDNILEDPPTRQAVLEMGSVSGAGEIEHRNANDGKVSTCQKLQVSDFEGLEGSEQELEPVYDVANPQASFRTAGILTDLPMEHVHESNEAELLKDPNSKSVSASSGENKGRREDDLKPVEANIASTIEKGLRINAFYDEVVHDMEEILLESSELPAARLNRSESSLHSQQPPSLRDGGPTASTSGTDDGYPLAEQPAGIDDIEVIGAKQRKGDISLGERLVGVKEHTVYVIHVRSGEHQWEVECRYRDFYTLYRRLKSLFAERGWILPSPWSSVERDSMKVFGNTSPNVIQERSGLIEDCLCSVLRSGYSPSLPSALVWFLSPPKALPSSPESISVGTDRPNMPNFGKKIPLILDIWPHKSFTQMLEAQHFTCAGCHRHFDDAKTRMLEFVQTFGWGKPKLCEYTGQLFCSSCHANDTAVLPARVLHHWDFTEYSVSQLAKSYLDSIVDQPMLCVSAVNPFLFSKVPTLLHVVDVRRKVGALAAYVRCPFRRIIYRGLGSRRYLLESNDFFALRDLIDLSKGAFSALPVILETVLKKIQEHITEQCLICCDVGVPCGGRQACDDPSSLIFPFQGEQEFERCASCKSVFHKHCFKKITECPCGVKLRREQANQSSTSLGAGAGVGIGDSGGSLTLFRRKSDLKSPVGFLSSLFTSARGEKPSGQKDGDNVILMGSFPPSM